MKEVRIGKWNIIVSYHYTFAGCKDNSPKKVPEIITDLLIDDGYIVHKHRCHLDRRAQRP